MCPFTEIISSPSYANCQTKVKYPASSVEKDYSFLLIKLGNLILLIIRAYSYQQHQCGLISSLQLGILDPYLPNHCQCILRYKVKTLTLSMPSLLAPLYQIKLETQHLQF